MANPAANDKPLAMPCESAETASTESLLILVAGMSAAWLAAGSTGLLGHALQHALTWAALIVALLAAWPRDRRTTGSWLILASGAAIGAVLTASTLPVVNVLGVTVVLAAIAQISRGLTGRVSLIATIAAAVLALYRLAYVSIPSVWVAADLLGWSLGRVAGWLVGCRLEVGATFGGIDFLVLMASIYWGWRVYTVRPDCRCNRWTATAILIGHLLYLIALAQSEKLLALLPAMVVTPETDINHVGLWTWSNGLRTMIPWNMPLLALVIQCVIAAGMVRWTMWIPVVELDAKQLQKLKEKEEKEEVPGSVLLADLVYRFGPSVLAVVATLLIALGLNNSDLTGKKILVHDKGYLNWLKPEYDSQVDGLYGMLPTLVESLGGKFTHSEYLLGRELEKADVLVLLHPDEPWLEDTLERVWQFVRRGGSLLVVGDPVVREGRSRSSFNEALYSEIEKTSLRVRQDTAVTRTGNWEQSYDVLAHPATLGIDDLRNRFGLDLGSSIRVRWPARPALVGRWGWSDPGSDAVLTGVSQYNAGELLGDLVLAAEQPIQKGRVFVLGGTSPLRNEELANSYPFVGRLLGYLANKPSTPQCMWRQVLGLLSLAALGRLLIKRPVAWQMMLTPAVLAMALVCCTEASYWSGRVLPDGRLKTPASFNNVAYIDASHLEAFDGDLWSKHGVAGLIRTLMRQGYLPLLAPDLTKERLERAGVLISIAPAKPFSDQEREAVKEFVGNGGAFLCMVGAEQARASAPLLADFGFTVPQSPLPPGSSQKEPEPLGAFRQTFGDKRYAQFYAAWPLECTAQKSERLVVWSDGKAEVPVVVCQTEHGGPVVVISDTYFAVNENLESNNQPVADNVLFWRWLFGHVVPGQKRWEPTPGSDGGPAAEGSEDENDDAEGSE